eukprot:Skav202729  [mRNA]  locus=scaffold1326:148193:152187:- [translate_table: standard]
MSTVGVSRIVMLLSLMLHAWAACLPNATEAIDRKDLKNLITGQSYAIGLWRNGDYPAARLIARVDILGYNVELKGPGGVTLDGFYALMGCSTPLISGDRGCTTSTTYVHINVEEKAYNAESINLDFYRDYNKSNQNPQTYFVSPGELNVSTLRPCGDTALTSKELLSNYAEVTGDLAGVVVDEGEVVAGRCFAEYFWYAPSCRADPTTCLVWLTGGNGWGMAELQPKRIMFPDYDPDAHAKGDRRSAVHGVSVDKHVSQDLSLLAPEVEEFMKRPSPETIEVQVEVRNN